MRIYLAKTVGCRVGTSDGLIVGNVDGCRVGCRVGASDGFKVGIVDGCCVGSSVGLIVGIVDGAFVDTDTIAFRV